MAVGTNLLGHEDLMVVVVSLPPPLPGGTEWVRPPAGKSRAPHISVRAVFPPHNVGPSVVHKTKKAIS